MPQTSVKTRLYETALDLMGRNGIAATSTREIIGAAGIRNPSAISYHFGSKAGLVEALAGELVRGQYPIFVTQTQLAAGTRTPTVAEWVAPVIDAAITLLESERGCLLARLWWEIDGYLQPQSLEGFLSGRSATATAWRAAIVKVFPQLPPQIGLARNVTMLRTVGWMVARLATMNLASEPFVARKHVRFRRWLEEATITPLSAPTTLTDEDVRGPDIP
jgi:AcrR family transcriptional regulator